MEKAAGLVGGEPRAKPPATSDAPTTTSAPAKERTFGDYVVLGKIGAGGMGQVFKARHKRMNRLVAIKVLSKEAVGSRSLARKCARVADGAVGATLRRCFLATGLSHALLVL